MKHTINRVLRQENAFKVIKPEKNNSTRIRSIDKANQDGPVLDNSRIGIIGGGLMGLVLAQRLSKLGAQVKVFEQDKQPGGLSTYANYGKFYWDKFYHVIVPSDGSLIKFIEEIGLGDKLRWQRAFSGYYVNKKFYSLNNPLEFLLFPLINLWDKVRLVFTIFYGSRINNWKSLEKYTVEDWLIKMGGKKNFEKFWAPLLKAKLGDNYKKVSGVFIWTYIRRMFKKKEHPVKKDHMGYVSGGYRTVFNRLERVLKEKGSSILLNTSVNEITEDKNGGITVKYDDKTEKFDKVVFTAPLNILEKVASPQLCEVVKKEQPIEYMGVVCLVLTTKKEVTPFYTLNIGDNESPFTGVIGISSLVHLDETAGEYITYFPKYIAKGHEYWSKSDSELKDLFINGVCEMYPELDENDIISSHLHRAFKVQPLQVLNFSEIIPETKSKHPDFYVLNTSQFVNDSVNNNTVVAHVDDFIAKLQVEMAKD